MYAHSLLHNASTQPLAATISQTPVKGLLTQKHIEHHLSLISALRKSIAAAGDKTNESESASQKA